MVCRRCHTANPDSSIYCSTCGSPLVRRPADMKRGIPWYVAAAGAVVLIAAGFFLAGLLSKRGDAPAPDAGTEERPADVQAARAADDRGPIAVTGEIAVLDVRGVSLYRSAATVVAGGWAAVPVAALFGAEALEYHGHDDEGEPGPVSVERGMWAAGEPVALVRIEGAGGAGEGAKAASRASELRPWRQALPLEWHALSADGGAYRIEAGQAVRRTMTAAVVLPPEVKRPGVFVQDGRVVGWTFGDGSETGYLWAGRPGAELAANMDVGELLDSIVAPSREAAFVRALALGGGAQPADRLRALAEAFDHVPLLDPRDMPPRLRREAVTREMHGLAADLIRRGGERGARDVLAIFGIHLLGEAADPELVKDAVLAAVAAEDHNRAIRYLERLKKSLAGGPNAARVLAGVDAFHAGLYKEWIREIVAKGGYYSGESAYEEARRAFPGDAEIHLLGVEVALAAGDHDLAAERLKEREYQGAQKVWADRLAARLETHEESQTVVIRFGPREEQIRLDATVNGMRRLEFIVDTGANTSSIPTRAARALGIKLDDSTRVVGVATAGGVGLAYKVPLDSIEVEGLKVRNLEVLVIDLPYDEEVGLLGLDFLRNFRYEIDNQKGTLTLRIK
jgi:clan AA aspartic protease (TIGR02281 family)